MVNKILVGIITVFLVVIGVELVIMYGKSPTQTITSSAMDQVYYPVQSGLMSSYIYPFELRGLPITRKLVVSSEYQGTLEQLNFEKGQAVGLKFSGNDVWVAFFKQPHGFQPSKCQIYDKTSQSYIPYDFSAPPFKKGDKIGVTLDVDYKNMAVACSMKLLE